ncbi:MAG: L-alanine-DL-glutamate epimerase-like enolase superfamily enzyme [Flavobacteriaceae bacterium]|jgi:L-alanine-DL-glutamate epimerase-like enolase superfamily enzyme
MNKELQLQLYNLKIPFRNSFSHTSATRSETQSVIIQVTDGMLSGFGEGCPREYVTGESLNSVILFFELVKDDLLKSVNSIKELNAFRLQNTEKIKANFAAWCSIELAFLDFFGRRQEKTLEELMNTEFGNQPTRYSAVIGDKSFEGFAKDVSSYKEYGFADFKLKLSGDIEDDYKKLSHIKTSIPGSQVRVDANNLWHNSQDVIDFVNNSPIELSGIEEPLLSKNLDELIELSKELKCKIVLDESFRTIDDLSLIELHSEQFILNLRVSKQGGLLNSLEIAKACIAQKLELSIGAQVGETAILTRASIALARCINNNVKTMEGAFGTLFLVEDLIKKSLQFGKGGVLNLEDFVAIDDKGNQLEIEIQTLLKYSHGS